MKWQKSSIVDERPDRELADKASVLVSVSEGFAGAALKEAKKRGFFGMFGGKKSKWDNNKNTKYADTPNPINSKTSPNATGKTTKEEKEAKEKAAIKP